MAIINIDGRDFSADTLDNLLHVCLSHGLDLPYFCWHPALGSVGACRQCAVKQFSNPDDKAGRIVMACMTQAADGTHISIADSEAAAFRASVIEWMMTNHPHDCPICEEGGECHLQDMTQMTGHTYRRYRFSKRTHRNQYLGPFIKHEMNRCISCYRCVRFYRDYAGGDDLDVHAAHNNVYFGRDTDGVLENEFSGNLVEVCPTGVFTDKTLSSAYNRKWDMRSTPSVCVHCGVGCNTCVSERGGQVRRILNRFNGAVNGYFLCDRGRFGYGFTNEPDRNVTPRLKTSAEGTVPLPKSEALEILSQMVSAGKKAIGIGSPRASLEANFALRTLVGPGAFYAGISAQEAACLAVMVECLNLRTLKIPTLPEIEVADAVFVLGEDVANTAPRLALAVRQAVRSRALDLAGQLQIAPWRDAAVRQIGQDIHSPLFVASPTETRLDDIATKLYHAAPSDIARLGFAVCHHIDNSSPEVDRIPEEIQAIAKGIADALMQAKRPLIVAGCQLGDATILRAAVELARALHSDERKPGIAMVAPECNSLGLAFMQNGSVQDAFMAVAQGGISTAIVLENDLYRRADSHAVNAFFKQADHVVVLDHISTETTENANIVLPCTNFAECEGTLINSEGRAQRFFQSSIPKNDVEPSWLWLRDISGTPEWRKFDDIVQALSRAFPVFGGITNAAPSGDFRVAGSRIRSEPHRYSGRTAVNAMQTIHEPKPAALEGSPYSSTMEGYYGPMPSPLIPFFWAPGWNSGQSLHKFQDEVMGSLKGGDSGVRLLESLAAGATTHSVPTIPKAFVREADRWLVVPRHHIFGSEELSARASAITELIKPPSLFLNTDDAQSLGVANGASLKVTFDAGAITLTLIISPELPSGVAAMSAGLPATCKFSLPAWATLRREAAS